MTVKATSPVNPDVDALAAEPDVITLSSGSVVRIDRLKTRGLFKLMKIVTRGAGPILMNVNLDFSNTEKFTSQFLSIVFMAIPEAEDEAMDFIQAMVSPVGYVDHPKTQADIDNNESVLENLAKALVDPEIDDTYSIIERIIHNEAGNISALGKRLATTLKALLPSVEAKN